MNKFVKDIKEKDLKDNNKLVLLLNDNKVELTVKANEVLAIVDWFDKIANDFEENSQLSAYCMWLNTYKIDYCDLDTRMIGLEKTKLNRLK